MLSLLECLGRNERLLCNCFHWIIILEEYQPYVIDELIKCAEDGKRKKEEKSCVWERNESRGANRMLEVRLSVLAKLAWINVIDYLFFSVWKTNARKKISELKAQAKKKLKCGRMWQNYIHSLSWYIRIWLYNLTVSSIYTFFVKHEHE